MVTKIYYKLDQRNNFEAVTIQGHADYAQKGQDVVCAAISAITNGAVNFLSTYYKNSCQITCSVAEIRIYTHNSNSEYQLCLRLMLHQLKNIAQAYPDYLKIKKKNILNIYGKRVYSQK